MDTKNTEITITRVADFVGLGVGSSISRVIDRYISEKVPDGVSIKVGSGKTHTLRRGKENVEFGYLGFGSFNEKPLPTFLSDMMLINPLDLAKELDGLSSRKLVKNPWNLLWCDPCAIVVTPYHKAWSQIHELAKSTKSRGTLGTGAGKAFFRASDAPERAIYAGELRSRDRVREKLIDTRNYVYTVIKDLSLQTPAKNATKFEKNRYKKDKELFDELHKWFEDDDNSMLDAIVDEYEVVGARIQFLTLSEALRKFNGTAVIERSHGVLADSQDGFKPYVSHLRTLPQLFDEKLRTAGYSGPIRRYGVHRAYEYRHNPGPMPTFQEDLRKKLGILPKRSENRLRGPIRTGSLDIPMMAYAINCCGGEDTFSGLIITCFDQILNLDEWKICARYIHGGGLLELSERLTTDILKDVTAFDITVKLKPDDYSKFREDNDFLFEFVRSNLAQAFTLNEKNVHPPVPLVGVSFGTDESRMIWRLNRQKRA
jgi:adenylosuccinate synthase